MVLLIVNRPFFDNPPPPRSPERITRHLITVNHPHTRVWLQWTEALTGGGARGGESKCNVLTRFDAFVLIVTDTGRPTHGHTDGYDGLGLGLNRYVKICMCYRSNSVYTRPGSAYIYAFIYKAQA